MSCMKKGGNQATKDLYRELRAQSCAELWEVEVPRFEAAAPRERLDRVALIRAVGVVFSERGSPEQVASVKEWLRKCLQDPEEKIRRYAMAALPKLGAGEDEEAQLLGLLRTTSADREKKFLGKTLDKIGGAATLDALAAAPAAAGALAQTAMKVRAKVARTEQPSTVRLDRTLAKFEGLKIYLRGRAGLEEIMRDEIEDAWQAGGKFRVADVRRGLVLVTPMRPFSLADLFKLRCFGTIGFELGVVRDGTTEVEDLAKVIASRLAQLLFETFTEGALRYRLNFAAKGHQRGAVHLVANRAFALCPIILNDARSAPWSIDVIPGPRGSTVELRPRISPDPRLWFRQRDVPAASHPPLAACLARVAGEQQDEVVWDPFCGSGLELIERALLGGVRRVIGTDLSAEAIEISEGNFAAAKLPRVESKFVCADFRDFAQIAALRPGSVSLVLTNPPMGKRVPIPNLRGLVEDLFAAAATVLRPGGRLVLANPLRTEIRHRGLTLDWWQIVDFGGFDCRMELHTKGR